MSETEQEIIPEVVALVPSTELAGIEKTIVDISRLTEQIAPLKKRVEAIAEIKTVDQYSIVSAALAEERILKRLVQGLFAPIKGIIAKAELQIKEHTDICDDFDRDCLAKMKVYEWNEEDLARREEYAINKKGGAHVSVKPNIPSTPGYRRSKKKADDGYRIEVTSKAWDEFLKAIAKGRKDLLQYVLLDGQALLERARSMKDEEKFMQLYPGVRCWRD
jgi:hypothetical protein